MADSESTMGGITGKAFMPAATSPQHVGHVPVHSVAPAAPVIKFPVSSPGNSISYLQGHIFKLEETNDRMEAEFQSLRSRMAIMEGPQTQTKPSHLQNWTDMMITFGWIGLGISVTFL